MRSVRLAAPATTADRVLGGVFVGLLMVLVTFVECFLINLRVSGVPCPVMQIAALVINFLAPKLAYSLTRARPATLIPAIVWAVISFTLAVRGPGEDVVVTGNWQGMTYLLLGTLGAVAGIVLAVPIPRRTAS
jgi:hypothetical protein